MTFWKKNRVWIMAMLTGMAAFVMIYGIKILDVTYDAWLLNGGDLSQHYLGWCFFRESDWCFPIGLMDRIAYPNHVSVIFTDSIPLFAVIFKLFRNFLPETFQYFGLWGLLCFGLQGAFGSVLIKHYCKHDLVSIIGSIFFVITPIEIYRMFMHTALGGQWLLLFAFLLGLKREKLSIVKKVALWGVLGFLCGSIHLYFLPMCGIIMCAFLLEELIRKKNLYTCLATGASYCICALVTVILLGGFSHDHQLDAGGLGQFSFNLNGFLNPQGWSSLLPDLPLYGDGAGEGLAFAGTGVLLLLAVGSLCWLVSFIRSNAVRKYLKKTEARNVLPFVIIFIVSVIISFSHQLALGNKALWEIPYPDRIVSLWGMFRSSGRFIWPAVYLVTLAAVVSSINVLYNKKMAAVALALALCIQIWDSSPQFRNRYAEFSRTQEYQSMLKDPQWGIWAKDKEHIVFVSFIIENQTVLYSLSNYAAENNMTINNFYFAHYAVRSDVEKALEENLKNPQKDTLYIYKIEDEELRSQTKMTYIPVDGIVVGVVD